MQKKPNEQSQADQLEESWDWDRPSQTPNTRPVGANLFLSEEDEPKSPNVFAQSSPKNPVHNAFMLSDEDPAPVPTRSVNTNMFLSDDEPEPKASNPANLGGFLSDDEPESPKPPPKATKIGGFGLISSESDGPGEPNPPPKATKIGGFGLISSESEGPGEANAKPESVAPMEDSMEGLFLGNRGSSASASRKEKSVDMDLIIESKTDAQHQPESIDNSQVLSQRVSKDAFNLEFVRAKTLLESKISPNKPDFEPEQTPCLYEQGLQHKEGLLGRSGEDCLRLRLRKVQREVKALEQVSDVQIKLGLARDATAQLIELFIIESKTKGGPGELDLQSQCKQILNEMRFGLPSLDKELESASFARLLEERFFLGEQEKYRLAFGTRFSQKKQIKELIQKFFKFHRVRSCLNEKEIDRPVQSQERLKGGFVESLIRRDLRRARVKGAKFFLEYILRNLGVEPKSKRFRSFKEKHQYVQKLLISKLQATKEPAKRILRVVLEVFKEQNA